MDKILSGNTSDFPDVAAFARLIEGLDQHEDASLHAFFEPAGDVIVTRAPGRLDVMGGIADYSGSLVLQMPIQEATLVALQERTDRVLQIVSLQDGQTSSIRHEMTLDDFEEEDGVPISYDAGRALFSECDSSWAGYVAGVYLVLMRDLGARFANGARILISSSVPEAMGVSSSAALEVATMQAVAAAKGMDLDPRELAILCQRVENLVVGAPCGVMDQISSSCGEAGSLLALLCQPADLLGQVSIPDDIMFCGIDSGIRHSVSGSDYGSVRVGAFMGYRILADLAGLEVVGRDETGALRIEDPRWSGYLANVEPSEFDQEYFASVPAEISGADFLARYDGTTDSVTRVEEDRTYAVRVPTRHPIAEHFRVGAFSKFLDGAARQRRLEVLGELMFQSHASYTACGLGSTGTDRIVELVREQGPSNGLYGAKITGGGSGGTVAVLVRRDAASALQVVADRYAMESDHEPTIFSGSSPGAGSFGHVRMRRE